MNMYILTAEKVEILTQQNWWIVFSLLVSAIFSPMIVHCCKNRFDNSKQIMIISNDILNINNKSGMSEPVTMQPKTYSNFILNNLTVDNKRETSQSITEIELYEIKKEPYQIQDIQFDGGFYNNSQKFVLLAYNNGNKKAVTPAYRVKYITFEKGLSKENLIRDQIIEEVLMESGDVKSLAIESFTQFYSEFETNHKLSDLKIVVVDEEGIEQDPLSLYVHYDRNEKKFVNHPRGFAGPPSEVTPLLDLRKDVKKQFVSCSQVLTHGTNNVSFTILVDRTCQLKYKVKLRSGKKVINNNKSYDVIIRVPIYTQEQGSFFGDFYHFLLKYNTELDEPILYDKNLIGSLEKELVFDRYKAARKFSGAKIE